MRKNYEPGDTIHLDLGFTAEGVASEALPDGYIAGTASTPSVDLHGHRVLKGAFDKSINEKGLTGPRGVKLLVFHDWHKPAGTIKRLETVGEDLKIAAQLNLGVSYVKDVHEIAKQNGGLNFSVGFRLKDFKFAEDEATKQEVLIVERGELMEVSVVCFPAQPDATMEFVKGETSPSEFEKLLMAEGWAGSRREAHELMKLCKKSSHLFVPPVSAPRNPPDHLMLDAFNLKAATDLTTRMKALLTR